MNSSRNLRARQIGGSIALAYSCIRKNRAIDGYQLSSLFKALTDPPRLRIMSLLLRSPFRISEMETILRRPQPFLSRRGLTGPTVARVHGSTFIRRSLPVSAVPGATVLKTVPNFFTLSCSSSSR